MKVSFKILGDPQAQERAKFRVITSGNRHIPVAYDPPKSKNAKKNIAKQAKLFVRMYYDMHVPIRMSLTFIMPRPKSLPKKFTQHVRKPDVDNLVKLVKDALSKVLYHDDAQIVEIHAGKVYAQEDEETGTLIEIEEMEARV